MCMKIKHFFEYDNYLKRNGKKLFVKKLNGPLNICPPKFSELSHWACLIRIPLPETNNDDNN